MRRNQNPFARQGIAAAMRMIGEIEASHDAASAAQSEALRRRESG
jgi:hypothetical protein